MAHIKFRAYYQYDGPTSKNPIASELSHDDVQYNLMMLENDFIHALDEGAKIQTIKKDFENKQVWMSIQANCSAEDLKSSIENVLGKAQLYGDLE